MSISSFVFQAFVLIEFLLRNPYPVVCSRLLCQTGILVFFLFLFYCSLTHSFRKKRKEKLCVLTYALVLLGVWEEWREGSAFVL